MWGGSEGRDSMVALKLCLEQLDETGWHGGTTSNLVLDMLRFEPVRNSWSCWPGSGMYRRKVCAKDIYLEVPGKEVEFKCIALEMKRWPWTLWSRLCGGYTCASFGPNHIKNCSGKIHKYELYHCNHFKVYNSLTFSVFTVGEDITAVEFQIAPNDVLQVSL